ncbi:hypothetical protein V5T82_14200 [Magnetovibrio sp. PR-2]|uniref:hypothetical protein n=1 Tax=Magnetovibrio sp. PR-2 TaxID=3120356 RepID=UPI002FCE4309
MRYSQFSFATGATNQIDARADKEIFKTACKSLTNFIPTPQGPFTSRRGLKWTATLTDEREKLFTYKFNDTQEYLLVFGNQQIKVFYDDELKATVTTGVPYLYDDLSTIKVKSMGDTLIIMHSSYPTKTLIRDGSHVDWLFDDFAWDTNPFHRYIDTKFDGSNNLITLNPNNNTTSGTVTASTAIFTDDWDGKEIRFSTSRGDGIIIINDGTLTATASTTAAYDIVEDLTGTGTDDSWKEIAYSPHRGYFTVCEQHDGRLYFAGVSAEPQRTFASEADNLYTFSTADTTASDPFTSALAGSVEVIKDMKSAGNLMVFTDSGEHEIHNNGAAISYTDRQVSHRTSYGINDLPAVVVDNEILFTTANGKELRGFVYNANTESFTGKNYTLIHDKVTNPTSLAYLRNYLDAQANYVFVLNDDGTATVCMINVEKDILGWSDITTNGTFNSFKVCNADHGNGKKDTLYAIVSRTNGVYLEHLTEDEVFLDCYYEDTNGTATDTWGAYAPLANEEVQVVTGELGTPLVHGVVTADGSGNITLNEEVTDIQVGYTITREFESLPLSPIVQGQLLRGRRIRVVEVELNIEDTYSINVQGKNKTFRYHGDNLLDQALTAFTGTTKFKLGGFSTDPTISISVTDPTEAKVRGYTVTIAV